MLVFRSLQPVIAEPFLHIRLFFNNGFIICCGSDKILIFCKGYSNNRNFKLCH